MTTFQLLKLWLVGLVATLLLSFFFHLKSVSHKQEIAATVPVDQLAGMKATAKVAIPPHVDSAVTPTVTALTPEDGCKQQFEASDKATFAQRVFAECLNAIKQRQQAAEEATQKSERAAREDEVWGWATINMVELSRHRVGPIEPTSVLGKAGLLEGDVITKIDGHPAQMLDDLKNFLRQGNATHTLHVERDGKNVSITVTRPKISQ